MYISELLPVRILFSESIILPDFLKHLLRRFCSSLEHIVIALLDFSVKLLFGKITGNNDFCLRLGSDHSNTSVYVRTMVGSLYFYTYYVILFMRKSKVFSRLK